MSEQKDTSKDTRTASPPAAVSSTTPTPSIANPPPAAETPAPPAVTANQRTLATNTAERDAERQPADR
eukprot:3006933-Pleurochrysis_carterae.AAC.1